MMNRLDFAKAKLRHFIPGRVRVKISQRPWDARVAQNLEVFFGAMEGVQKVMVRSFSGSITFYLSGPRTSADAFWKALQEYCRANFSELDKCLDPTSTTSHHDNSPFLSGASLAPSAERLSLITLAGLGGFLVAAFFKRILWGSGLAQGPFSAAGMVSLAAVVLLWRKNSRERHPHHRRLLPMVNGAALLAVAASRALTAVEILFVEHVSLWVEKKSEQRAVRYLAESFPALPETVDILEGASERERALSEISAGDVVVVRQGQVIPVDGFVQDGIAAVDESHLTGRAFPTTCRQGCTIFAGSRVLEGTLWIMTEKSPQETTLARLQSMVFEGLRTRTDLERRAETYSRWTLSLGLWATAATVVSTVDFQKALSVFLVFACPCAMVLAASSVITTAVAALVRRAVVVKSGRSLEMAPLLNALCFDKTGTLMAGVLCVHEVHPRAPWMNGEEILGLAAAAENQSPHPVAIALRHAAEKAGRPIPAVEEQEIFPGHGVRARVGGHEVLLGSESFMRERGISVGYFAKRAQEHRGQGRLVVYVVKNKRLQALVVLSSAVRDDLSAFLQALRNKGIRRLELLSGDSSAAFRRFSEGLPFDAFLGDLDPEGKVRRVEGLQKQGYRVGMIGDGINDSPAMSRADLGVALGPYGAAAALETADVVLLDGDVRKCLVLRHTGEKMLRQARANFLWATSSNILGAVAAVTGIVGPGAAGLLHVMHTGLILLNAARMFRSDSDDVTPLSPK